MWGFVTTILGLRSAARTQSAHRGRLIVVAGLAYYISNFRAVDVSAVHAGAFILSYLWVAVLGHVALSWARSLIGQGTARALIVLCYAAALGTQSWRVWSDRGLTPSKPWWDEGARPPTTAETIGTTTP
jgi:hypothetical protein